MFMYSGFLYIPTKFHKFQVPLNHPHLLKHIGSSTNQELIPLRKSKKHFWRYTYYQSWSLNSTALQYLIWLHVRLE